VLIGTYNREQFSTYNYLLGAVQDDNGSSSFGYVDLVLNNKKLRNTYSNIYYVGSTGDSIQIPGTIAEPVFLGEQYTLNTLDDNNSIGQISWSSNYITSQISSFSPPTVQAFMVNGKLGIYKKVVKVIIDFNDNFRAVYFIKNKSNKHSSH